MDGLKDPLMLEKYGRLLKFICGHTRIGYQGDRERPSENDNQYLKMLDEQNLHQITGTRIRFLR